MDGVVISETDKSKKISLIDETIYNENMEKFENGKELSEKDLKTRESEMRGHMRSFERIFEIGIDSVNENQVKRIDSSLKVINAKPAPMKGLLKDHKKELSFRPVSK